MPTRSAAALIIMMPGRIRRCVNFVTAVGL